MNIGFDLDNVIVKYPPLFPSSLIDTIYKKKTPEGLAYRIPGVLEQKLRIVSHYPLMRPQHRKNTLFVKGLAGNKQYKKFLISSRFGFLKKRTEVLVRKYQLDKVFDHLYFNYTNKQPHLFKDALVKKLHIERYVDDDLPLLRYLATNNKSVKFYWLNKKVKRKLNQNLFAITDISHMLH